MRAIRNTLWGASFQWGSSPRHVLTRLMFKSVSYIVIRALRYERVFSDLTFVTRCNHDLDFSLIIIHLCLQVPA